MDISSVESQQSKVSAHESSVELPLSLVVFPDVSITPDSGLGRSLSTRDSSVESSGTSYVTGTNSFALPSGADAGLVCPLLVESEIESAAPSAGTVSADCSGIGASPAPGFSFSYLLSLYIMPSVPAIPLSKPYASSAGASSAAASSAISSAEPAVAAFCIIENSGAAVSLPAISAADADESAIAPEDIITLEALREGTRFTAATVIAAHAATAPPMYAIRRSGSGFLGSSSG